MTELSPAWHTALYGTPVFSAIADETVTITLSAVEVLAIRMAAKGYSYAGGEVDNEIGMRYGEVGPVLRALAAKLLEMQA